MNNELLDTNKNIYYSKVKLLIIQALDIAGNYVNSYFGNSLIK